MNIFNREHENLITELKKIGSTDGDFCELSKRTGVHRSTIRKMATGLSSNPTIGVLSKLHDAINDKNSIDTKNETAALKTHSRITTAPEHSSSDFPVHF